MTYLKNVSVTVTDGSPISLVVVIFSEDLGLLARISHCRIPLERGLYWGRIGRQLKLRDFRSYFEVCLRYLIIYIAVTLIWDHISATIEAPYTTLRVRTSFRMLVLGLFYHPTHVFTRTHMFIICIYTDMYIHRHTHRSKHPKQTHTNTPKKYMHTYKYMHI